MAEEPGHPTQTAQHGEDANEEIVERNELLKEAIDGPGDPGKASSNHSRPRHETSRPEENQSDRTTPPCSPKTHASPQTFRCWYEGIESSEIKDFIYEPAQPSAPRSRLFRPKDADCEAWVSASNPKCPASFGSQGTTATSGAFGQLVHCSEYLGAGNSGMFSAGHRYIEEPYSVTLRARDIHFLASESFEQAQRRQFSDTFGLKFLNLELLDDARPKLKWFQYQWPRYKYGRRCFKSMESVGLTIQFIVRDRTVFQQCILENRGKTDVCLDLAFCKGMRIWDLDHVTNDYGFNKKTSDSQDAGPGPGGFGWVHVNRFREGSPDARTDSQHSSRSTKSNRSHSNRSEKDQPNHGVALVVSMAVGGEMIRFSPGQSAHIWKQTLKAKSSTPGSKSQKLEIVTAYKLVLLENPLSDWKTFVVPLKKMNPSRFLREAKALSWFRTSITRISETDYLAYSYDRNSETLRDEENERDAGILNVSQDAIPAVDSQPQTEPSPAINHESAPEKTSPIMNHIEFAVRRNLEHILGVCAIPVTVHVSEENAEGVIWQKLRDVEPIALSCGDLSGHRICTTSSFFAFQFLAEVAKRLRLSRLRRTGTDDTHVQILLSQIRDVCLGHLKWLYAAEKTDDDETFSSLYWVSGEAVTLPKSSGSWAPREHVRNTAFQILKAMEFANSFDGDDDGDSLLVGEMISQWGRGWVRSLERSDWRESHTWSHKKNEGLSVFRLDDHVWIWRALKAMEDKRLGAWSIMYDRAERSDSGSSTDSDASNGDEILRRRRKFAPWTVQQEVVRNFTTEHAILRKEMLALTRSPRETRFLFHARDTALFYGQDMEFFPEDASFQELWKNTIDAQRFHENNQETRWDNALRYALSIMLSIRGHQINNRKPEEMVRNAIEILLRSSSENGTFPGKLDIMTKDPLEDVFHTEEDAESYYNAGFEIPYVFLTHAKAIGAIIDNAADPELKTASGDVNLRHHPTGKNPNSTEAMPAHHDSKPQGQVHPREEDEELRRVLAKLSDVLSARPYLPNSTSASDRTGSRELVVDARLALKKAIPFSNLVDPHNIVEIEDEWLFNYPDLFGSEKDEDTSIDETLDSLQDLNAAWLTRVDVAEMRRKYSSHNNEDGGPDDQSILSSGGSDSITTASSSSNDSDSTTTASSISFGGPGDSELRVVDMPSGKRLQGKAAKDLDIQLGSFESIWERISRPRTVAKAKKRMVYWTRRGTELGLEAALMCYAVTKGDERASMLEFFERHFRHENFMFDHCDLAYNTWDTELHLSFFILEDASEPLSGEAVRNVEGFPGVKGKHISRGSIGIRFHGDAFDRYWTFHLFANLDLKVLSGKIDAFTNLGPTDESVLFQRKVIEPHFFSIMLSQVESKTEQILAKVKVELGIKSGAFSWSVPSMDKYSSWSKRWEGFAPLLQALADDLTSTQDIIGQWETREGARGQERPRWTHNDERKYRAAITRAQRVLKWRKKGIQDLLDDVESLREACTSRLANAREELSFRSNQNIASFTYVTIVFLPLGFAASVFSMNGYPAAGWVASMAVIAVVALTITAVALANAKLLLAVAEQFSADVLRLTAAVFQSSLIGQQQRQRDERAQDGSVPNKPSHGDPKGGDPLQSHATRHVLFWMAYLLIELPARRVALACRALPTSLIQSLGLTRPDATPPASGVSTGARSGPGAAAVGSKIIRIAGGLLIMPLLLISWTIQLFLYNVLDILTFLGRLMRKTFYALVAPSDANGSATDTKMVTWLIEPPSSLRPVRKYMSRDEKSEKPTPQADTPVAADKSESGPLEEV